MMQQRIAEKWCHLRKEWCQVPLLRNSESQRNGTRHQKEWCHDQERACAPLPQQQDGPLTSGQAGGGLRAEPAAACLAGSEE